MNFLTRILVLTILGKVLLVSYSNCQTDAQQSPSSTTLPQSSLSDGSVKSDSSLEVTLSSNSAATVINSSSLTDYSTSSSSPSPRPVNTQAVVTSRLSTPDILTADVSTQSSVTSSVDPLMTSSKDLPMSSTSKTPPAKVTPSQKNLSTADMVAIICGCLLIFVTVLLYVIDGLILKYVKVPDISGAGITKRSGDAAFYEGLHPQSSQTLVGAMSSQSFATSPSVDQLNAMGHAVYYNRGYEIDQHADGPHHPVVQFDLSAAPGTRGSKKFRSSFNQSSA